MKRSASFRGRRPAATRPLYRKKTPIQEIRPPLAPSTTESSSSSSRDAGQAAPLPKELKSKKMMLVRSRTATAFLERQGSSNKDISDMMHINNPYEFHLTLQQEERIKGLRDRDMVRHLYIESLRERHRKEQLIISDIVHRFHEYDMNGDGSLDFTEFKHVLADIQVTLEPVHLMILWKMLDKEGAGVIGCHQFIELVRHQGEHTRGSNLNAILYYAVHRKLRRVKALFKAARKDTFEQISQNWNDPAGEAGQDPMGTSRELDRHLDDTISRASTVMHKDEMGDHVIDLQEDHFDLTDISPNAPYRHRVQRNGTCRQCWHYYRLELHFTMEDSSYSCLAMGVFLLIMTCIALSTVHFVFESVPELEDWGGFVYFEWFFSMVFTVELFLRLIATRNPWRFWKQSWFFRDWMNVVDLLSVVPFYIELAFADIDPSFLRSLRLIRLTRLMRLRIVKSFRRNFEILQASIQQFMRDSASLIIILFGLEMLLCSSLVYVWERGQKRQPHIPGNPLCPNDPVGLTCLYMRWHPGNMAYEVSPFASVPQAFWWVLVTITTVGYGDMVPLSGVGQIIGVMTMLTGVSVFAIYLTLIMRAVEDSHDQAMQVIQLRERANWGDLLGDIVINRCPAGHKLVKYEVPAAPQIQCGQCAQAIPTYDAMWVCAECEYYICPNCKSHQTHEEENNFTDDKHRWGKEGAVKDMSSAMQMDWWTNKLSIQELVSAAVVAEKHRKKGETMRSLTTRRLSGASKGMSLTQASKASTASPHAVDVMLELDAAESTDHGPPTGFEDKTAGEHTRYIPHLDMDTSRLLTRFRTPRDPSEPSSDSETFPVTVVTSASIPPAVTAPPSRAERGAASPLGRPSPARRPMACALWPHGLSPSQPEQPLPVRSSAPTAPPPQPATPPAAAILEQLRATLREEEPSTLAPPASRVDIHRTFTEQGSVEMALCTLPVSELNAFQAWRRQEESFKKYRK